MIEIQEVRRACVVCGSNKTEVLAILNSVADFVRLVFVVLKV
jgi:hypothetical protein